MIVDLNTLFSVINRTFRQNIKRIADLNNTVEQMDLTNIYRILYPTAAEYTFFSKKRKKKISLMKGSKRSNKRKGYSDKHLH